MKKIIFITLLTFILILLIGQGCKKTEVSEKPTTATTTATDTEQNINDVGEDISGVGDIEEDLNISDLDNLERELDEINW